MSIIRKLTGTYICIALILQSCIYEFHPKALSSENFLVIYGMVTTENGPHEITILKTNTIGSTDADSVSGAIVSISDNNGNIIPLTEFSSGRYHTPKTFAGQIGTKYKLNIELQEGKQYQSDYVELIDVPGISELRADHIIKEATATTASVEGYQFYLNTEPGNSGHTYIKWEIKEDWEFHLLYDINFYWDGQSLSIVDIPKICYQQSHLKDIHIANTSDYQINYLTNYPLYFIARTWKLQYGYGITVRQYALSSNSYKFWKDAVEISNPDPVNSKQPYQLIGNLKCISNPDESVFGIFEASAVKFESIQVEKLPNYYYQDPGCSGDIHWIPDVLPEYLIYLGPTYLASSKPNGYIYGLQDKCMFCKAAGGTTIRPKYWKTNK
jgi:hypothetical protein